MDRRFCWGSAKSDSSAYDQDSADKSRGRYDLEVPFGSTAKFGIFLLAQQSGRRNYPPGIFNNASFG